MIIQRSEVEEIKKLKPWLFIFGRRKTGKTFLVRNYLQYNDYFFVKNNKLIISEKHNKEMIYDTFIEILKISLEQEHTIVIDEFQRLGTDFLDFLHYTNKKGRIILISSTLYLSKTLLSSKSPILGLFAEVNIGLPKLKDTLNTLKDFKLEKKTFVEASILLREPIVAEYFDDKILPRDLIVKVLMHTLKAVPSMIGEVFSEEERSLSGIYEGVLRAVANGKVVSTEISNYLFSNGLIKKNNSGMIQQYLKNLVEFGILKKMKVFDKNKFVYKHVSPLAKLFYYADEKYNFSERIVNDEEVKRIVDELMPKLVEDNLREFLAKYFGLEECIYEGKDFDVDACLVKFKKIDVAVEIKWKESISNSEIELANKKLSALKSKTKLLFVQDKTKIKTSLKDLKIVDIEDFI